MVRYKYSTAGKAEFTGSRSRTVLARNRKCKCVEGGNTGGRSGLAWSGRGRGLVPVWQMIQSTVFAGYYQSNTSSQFFDPFIHHRLLPLRHGVTRRH